MSTEKPEQYVYQSTEEERSFERSYLNVAEAHAKAVEKLGKYEVDLEMFTGLYGKDIIEKDKAEIDRIKKSWGEQPSKNYADILEAIVCEHGELSDWFGPRAEVIKTSPFDDIRNGIDMVIEFDDEENRFSHLALGVDVTFGNLVVEKKLKHIKDNIDNDHLGQIKYFHSDRQNFTGRLQKIPQVVVGVEIDRVNELGLLWMNRRNKELGNHPIQTIILKEIKIQLEAFRDYTRTQKKTDLVARFEKDLNIVNELLLGKNHTTSGVPITDKVFASIKEVTGRLFSTT